MLTLQEQLERELKENGESDPVVQMLRNQITAEQSGKNFQELYSEITELEESVDPSFRETKPQFFINRTQLKNS